MTNALDTLLTLIRGTAILLCGLIVGLNLAHLVGFNPNYDAAWWKVAAAVAFGYFMTFRVKGRR